MSSWLKIKGTQTGEIQLGFTGPILQDNSGNLNVRNSSNTALANITVQSIVANGTFSGNGALLTDINGSNVTGTVANATYAINAGAAGTAGTVTTNAQPNITSVGTLSNLSVTGNITAGNVYANAGNISANFLSGTLTTAAQPNITSIGTLSNLTVTGNIVTGNISGNGAGLTGLTGANITGQVSNSLVAGTVYTNSQPNITSVGTLTNLDVSGNIIAGGNLLVNGNLVYVNVEQLAVEDPIIEMGNGPNNQPLTTNDGKDRGTLLHYYTTQPVDAFMGWDNSNGEFSFGSNVSVSNDVVTFNTLGNVRAGFFIGDGSQLTNLNIANATVANANYASFAGVAYSVSGGNVSGQVGNALIAGTVYTNAQPNITSVGNLTGLTVTGTSTLGNIGNVKITGGNVGDIIITDGTGNLSFVAPISGESAWKVNSTTVSFNSSASIVAMLLPANAIVDRVSVIVDTAFNGTAPTLSVGKQGGSGFEYSGINDTNLKVTDRYDLPSQLPAVGVSGNIEILYTSDGSTAGSARILVTYAIPE